MYILHTLPNIRGICNDLAVVASFV